MRSVATLFFCLLGSTILVDSVGFDAFLGTALMVVGICVGMQGDEWKPL